MARPKRQSKRTSVKFQCECHYNKNIHSLFEESFEAAIKNPAHYQEYFEALTHSDRFMSMCDVAHEEGMEDPVVLLVDAVRFGAELGRRKAELDNLEAMVKSLS